MSEQPIMFQMGVDGRAAFVIDPDGSGRWAVVVEPNGAVDAFVGPDYARRMGGYMQDITDRVGAEQALAAWRASNVTLPDLPAYLTDKDRS